MYFYSPGVAICAKKSSFSLLTNLRDGDGWEGDGGHTVWVRGGQQGVRARVRASGKALEGDDRHRQTDDSSIIVRLLLFFLL